MLIRGQGNRQCAERAGVTLRPLESQAVQLLVLQLRGAFLTGPLVLLAVGPLAVHATILDEAAGSAVLELDGVAPVLTTVGADSATIAVAVILAIVDRLAAVHGG